MADASSSQAAPAQPAATGAASGPQALPTLATPQNIQDLATLLMSEASVGNDVERRAVGSTVLNRMARNGASTVRGVWNAYAHNQAPTPEMTALAEDLLQGHAADPTNGATHYYSPRSMPDENSSAADLAAGRYDVGGGLEQVPGLPRRTYRPGFSAVMPETTVTGVRPTRYRFYRAPGSGAVQ